MLTIVNNTGISFNIQLGAGIQGPDQIKPDETCVYSAPGSVPERVLGAFGDGDQDFAIIHDQGKFLFMRGGFFVAPPPSADWGGQFVLLPG